MLGDVVADASGPSRASGMLASHYAPRCVVRLVDDADDAVALRAGTPNSEILDLTDDLVVYAHDLYARLRDADARGVGIDHRRAPPAVGLGHADPRPPHQGRGTAPTPDGSVERSQVQSTAFRLVIQRSRTAMMSGVGAPSTPAIVRLTVEAPASGTTSSRHQHSTGSWRCVSSR